MTSSYDSSVDPLILTWTYFSDEFKNTGLGTQPFGATTGQSPPRGYFLVTLNGTHTLQTLSNFVEIPLSLRTSLGLDILPSWDASIVHVEGSFSSGPSTLTLVPQ